MNQVNLKELTLEQLKSFAWDLQTAAQQYSQMLQTVTNEINSRLQQEALSKQKQQEAAVANKPKAVPPQLAATETATVVATKKGKK